MKKFLSVILSITLCFSLAFAASAAGGDTGEDYSEIVLTEENLPDEDVKDAPSSTDELIPSEKNEELEKLTALAEKAATLIYNYATQPEEPAVDLATVITIVRIAVTVIYTLISNYA